MEVVAVREWVAAVRVVVEAAMAEVVVVRAGRGCWSTHSCCRSCSRSFGRSPPPVPTRHIE